MKWTCEKSATGHALAPARDEEALWSGWACSHCGERFKRRGDPDSYELPLMSSVVEVDELALMLDGTTSPRTGMRLVGCVRFLESGMSFSGGGPLLERYLKTEADVAQAILELEGLADWRPYNGPSPIQQGTLADQALKHAGFYRSHNKDIDTFILKAAARLRDGWRPKKWRAK